MERRSLKNLKNLPYKMENKNTQAFLALVKAGLFPVNDLQFSDKGFDYVDWDEVYRLAQEQSVVGLVATGVEVLHSEWLKVYGSPLMPQNLALTIASEVLQLEKRNRAMNAFIASLIDKMRAVGIYTLLVKGQGIAQCYEKPLWRTSGDVDLFLSEENYAKAKEILVPLASSVDEEYEREKHLGMTIDGWVVELHGHLYSGLSSRIDKELDEVYVDSFYGGQVRSWNNNEVHVFLLGVENDAFYVFTHILQHFYKGGIGLRQICDWCRLLWTYRDSLNHELLEQRIKRAGLMSEWRAFGALAVEYLGMPEDALPFYAKSTKWEKRAKQIMEFMMMSGNFGHNRDSSYMKYPYLVRKCFSMGRRIGDLFRHARIFPMDSLRFSFTIMKNGLVSAMRGE